MRFQVFNVPGTDPMSVSSLVTNMTYSLPFFDSVVAPLDLILLCCCSWDTCRIVLESARDNSSPVVIRITSMYHAAMQNDPEEVAVGKVLALALDVQTLAREYRVPVILQTETRCLHKLIHWYDRVLEASDNLCRQKGGGHREPLFSTHLLHVSDWEDVYFHDELVALTEQYLERLTKRNIWLLVRLPGNMHLKTYHRLANKSTQFSIVFDSDNGVMQHVEYRQNNFAASVPCFVLDNLGIETLSRFTQVREPHGRIVQIQLKRRIHLNRSFLSSIMMQCQSGGQSRGYADMTTRIYSHVSVLNLLSYFACDLFPTLVATGAVILALAVLTK